jgi:Domain of unknown function (DUF4232)
VISPRMALAAAACAGMVLAACSSGPTTPKSSTTTTNRAHAPTTSSSSTSSTTSSTSPSTTSSAAPAACNNVSAAAGGTQGAAGTITGVVTVTNTGATACSADGYPTVGLFSGSGAPLTVTMVNGLSVSLSPPANAPPTSVPLAPSGTAQFSYQISDVPVGNETSCPASETARVTMPGATSPSPAFALAIAPCANGTVRVSPVYASS